LEAAPGSLASDGSTPRVVDEGVRKKKEVGQAVAKIGKREEAQIKTNVPAQNV